MAAAPKSEGARSVSVAGKWKRPLIQQLEGPKARQGSQADPPGMAKKTDFETRSIVKRLLVFFPAFYIVYFIVSIVVLAAARQPITAASVFTTPFAWEQFTPARGADELGMSGNALRRARRQVPPRGRIVRIPRLTRALLDLLSANPAPAVPFVALLVTFIACGPLLLFVIVANTRQCWDFTATITFFHWVLTCLVTLAFPLNWIWWVAFLVSPFFMSTMGELSCYYLRDMREIQLEK
jgi:hypothetical protein